MQWYQVHLKVLSRMFELGLFDEVNSCYRNYCLENTKDAYEQLLNLVINDAIKQYCCALRASARAKNSLTASQIVAYYVKATACFTMAKALQKICVGELKDVVASDEMPDKYYQMLFKPNGELKDDVLIQAFNEQTFTFSPQFFVTTILRFDINKYLSSYKFKLPSENMREFNLRNIFTPIQYLISRDEETVLRREEAENKTSSNLANNASTAKEVNYFHVDSKLDSGFGLLRIFDLLGMHLLLVAQRRMYLSERFIKDDLISNYKALEQVNSDDIVRLHNNAVVACGVFAEAQKSIISNDGKVIDFNEVVKAYVGRNDALYQYLCYFWGVFKDLDANIRCTNNGSSWAVSFYYYDLRELFKQFFKIQSQLSNQVNELLAIDVNQVNGCQELLSFDQEITNNLVDMIPANIYAVCAHVAPSYKNASLSHPRVVNFQDIVSSCLSYSKTINQATPTLPYPIKLDSKINREKYLELSWFKREENEDAYIQEMLAYEVINDPKPIEFSRSLNAYLDVFCYASIMVELYNNIYLKNMVRSTNEFQSNSNLRFTFDLGCCGIDWVKDVYPTYEKLLKDETFAQLIETHKACFEKLVVILNLQGESHLLYKDGYTSNLLRKTNHYDQAFANKLATGHASRARSSLNNAEQILLNNTCISYLQECQKLCQIGKEMAKQNTDLDKLLNEKTGNFIAEKSQLFSNIQNVCLTPIRALSQYLMLNLDNIPEELKLSVGILQNNALTTKINLSFYKCVYDSMLTIAAKNMNAFLKFVVPYSNLEGEQDFANSIGSVCMLPYEGGAFKNINLIMMVAAKRLLQSYGYDEGIYKQICHNTLFVNCAVGLMLAHYSLSLKYIMIPLVKDFVQQVLSFTESNQLKENEEYLNAVYTLVHKLSSFFSTHQAKLNNLDALIKQDNVILSECFEYKKYLIEISYLLFMSQCLCFKYMFANKNIMLTTGNCDIGALHKLFQDLLEDAPKVLQSIDLTYFKNICTKKDTLAPYFKDEEYINIDSEYIINVMEIVRDPLSRQQLSVVERFFGKDVCAIVQKEEDAIFNSNDFMFYRFFNRRSHGEELTKDNKRIIKLAKGKVRLLEEDELHQALNIEVQTIATPTVDSSASALASSNSKSNAKSTSKSKAATKDAADANVIIEPLDAIEAEAGSEAKPKAKAKSTHSKAKKAEEASEEKTKAKSTTKATATKSKAKKVATISSNEATVTVDSAEVTEDKPQKKATRAKKASTARAKAIAGKDASAQASPEVEIEAEAKPMAKANSTTKATATKSRAKKVAAVDSTEAKADEDADAKPKKKATTARTTSKASASTRAKKSTAKS